jgi:glucose-1-phosphate adenylyltransferase
VTGDTLAIILAGGHGSRLQPLTKDRAKPAVPFGGKYRIIDFPLANCLHSGVRKVLVLTQYKSHSLQKHLRDGWSIFNSELGEFITPVPPQMRTGEDWYRGTADAIYQNIYLLERSEADEILVLSGDHIYRMDYAEMLRHHREHPSSVTVAAMDVPIGQAEQFGVLGVDETGLVTSFEEKPFEPVPLADDPSRALVSMGIYVFDREFLIQTLQADHENQASFHDFGRDILPSLLDEPGVYAYRFGGKGGRVTQDRYWRDVGTIDAYYEANMALLEPVPPLDLYQPDWTIRTHQAQQPPARTVPGPSGNEGVFVNSILAGGVIVSGGGVDHSILFPRVLVKDEAIVEDSILFEGVEIGSGSRVRKCIIDKHVRVPPGTQIGMNAEQDRRRFQVSPAGVVVVPKGYEFDDSQPD